jgi:hypothetical protein
LWKRVLGRVVHNTLVLLKQKHHPDLSWGVQLQDFFDSDKVLQWFTHLEALDVQVTCMDPIVDPLIIFIVTFGLSNLILMMGEHQIPSSRVNVYITLLEDSTTHGWALNMPAWSTFAPRRIPGWFTWLRVLPKYKVELIFLFSLEVFILSRQNTLTF